MEKERTIVKIKITENTTGEELFLAVWQAHGDAVGEPERRGWTAGRDYPFICGDTLLTVSQYWGRGKNAGTRYTKVCRFGPHFINGKAREKTLQRHIFRGESKSLFAEYAGIDVHTVRKPMVDAYRANAVEILEDDNARE